MRDSQSGLTFGRYPCRQLSLQAMSKHQSFQTIAVIPFVLTRAAKDLGWKGIIEAKARVLWHKWGWWVSCPPRGCHRVLKLFCKLLLPARSFLASSTMTSPATELGTHDITHMLLKSRLFSATQSSKECIRILGVTRLGLFGRKLFSTLSNGTPPSITYDTC